MTETIKSGLDLSQIGTPSVGGGAEGTPAQNTPPIDMPLSKSIFPKPDPLDLRAAGIVTPRGYFVRYSS